LRGHITLFMYLSLETEQQY